MLPQSTRVKSRFSMLQGASRQRMRRNEVIVALANKIARVAWKILTKPGEIYRWAKPNKSSS
jgi:transposase